MAAPGPPAPLAPPILTLHGTHDEAVPFSQALSFGRRALAVGAPDVLVPHVGQMHLFTPAGHQRVLEQTFGFVEGTLGRGP